ncbi:hypothetical protein ESCO_005066 [Escovopsis weberi]|uniref:Uncharacterized protein n=1 Tax=Escovopsis weberi TaxID=150374 RepID=A0A0M8MYW0_ESCWE|nr:hypothetical protein ESCO_005066 [Escovopsis weberi]
MSHLRDTIDGASFQTTNLSTVSLEELSRIQPLAPVACNRHNSVDRQTTTTSSSAALPASFWRNHRLLAHIPGRWPLFPAPLRLNRQTSPISEETDAAAATAAAAAAAAARSSQQPRNSCPILFRASQEPSNDRHSVLTSSSFASTENWRIMAWQETSRRLAGQATPHRPPRPVSPLSVTEPGETTQFPPGVPGGGLELMSPSKWGDLEDQGGTAGAGPDADRARADGDASRLTTPPVVGFEVDFDAKFMSDGREGAMRTIKTVLGGEGTGKGEKPGHFI